MNGSKLLFAWAAAALLAGTVRADVGPPAPKPTTVFRAADYRSPRFHVTSVDYKANGLELRMVQVQDREPLGFICRGWLQIRPAGDAPRWIYRGNLESVGSSYGLFVPRAQPMPGFFLIVEINGYEAKLLLLDRMGKIREVPGGAYVVDLQRRLLFSRSFADGPLALAVLDLDSGKTLFTGIHKEIYNWYRLDSDLYFTASQERVPKLQEDRTTGYFYDVAKRTVKSRILTPKIWSRAEPVEVDFDPRRYQDCTSEERQYGQER